MIKPWVFQFLPELADPSVEPDPRDVRHFTRYLDLWVRDEALAFSGAHAAHPSRRNGSRGKPIRVSKRKE
jgi:hypothetical protein